MQDPTALVAARTGLHLRESDAAAVMKAVLCRVRDLGLPSVEDYLCRLTEETPEGGREARELTVLLTVGESYFFRDQGQFALLRSRVLPELLTLHARDRVLRLWSAGCATGEEPYSLAILLRELIPDPDQWDIRILGTDIQETFLDSARSGAFGDWSFRAVPPEVKDRWFTKTGGFHRLDPRIRGMVTFRPIDLLRESFPEGRGDLVGMDLILCRNMFIYYNREAVAAVAEKLTRSLREGGYLMTGHGELFSSVPPTLIPRIFPESMIYQRGGESLAVASEPPRPAAIPRVSRKATRERAGKAQAPRQDPEALCRLGEAFANRGDHDRAVASLKKAIAADPLAPRPYYLLAHVAEERGERAVTRENLKKVLYLDPGFLPAYFELAALYEGENDFAKARQTRQAVLDRLRSLPESQRLEPYGEMTVEEVIRSVENLLH
ncbi:MAG: tetratricopeptide repeat protein [Nitrospirae bacterium]|nr:tetratricopeptide repeat protein [Nitrospirota bacterium]